MRITVNPRLPMAWALALLIASILLPAGLAVARGHGVQVDDPIESTPFLDSLDAPEAAEASGEGEESEGDAKAGAAEEKKPEGEAAEASGESATPEGDTNAGAAEENESEEAAPTEQG